MSYCSNHSMVLFCFNHKNCMLTINLVWYAKRICILYLYQQLILGYDTILNWYYKNLKQKVIVEILPLLLSYRTSCSHILCFFVDLFPEFMIHDTTVKWCNGMASCSQLSQMNLQLARCKISTDPFDLLNSGITYVIPFWHFRSATYFWKSKLSPSGNPMDLGIQKTTIFNRFQNHWLSVFEGHV